MPEHVHLVVYPLKPKYETSEILKAIKEPVERQAVSYVNAPEWIPRITRRRGKRTESCFWQSGGGFDSNVIEPAALWQMIEYIHFDPVRRGLAERASDWKWSSAAWYEGSGSNGLAPDSIPLDWMDNKTRVVI